MFFRRRHTLICGLKTWSALKLSSPWSYPPHDGHLRDTSTARGLSLLDITLLAVAEHVQLQWGGEAGVTKAAAATEWVAAYSRLYLSAVITILMCLRLSCTWTTVDI